AQLTNTLLLYSTACTPSPPRFPYPTLFRSEVDEEPDKDHGGILPPAVKDDVTGQEPHRGQRRHRRHQGGGDAAGPVQKEGQVPWDDHAACGEAQQFIAQEVEGDAQPDGKLDHDGSSPPGRRCPLNTVPVPACPAPAAPAPSGKPLATGSNASIPRALPQPITTTGTGRSATASATARSSGGNGSRRMRSCGMPARKSSRSAPGSPVTSTRGSGSQPAIRPANTLVRIGRSARWLSKGTRSPGGM